MKIEMFSLAKKKEGEFVGRVLGFSLVYACSKIRREEKLCNFRLQGRDAILIAPPCASIIKL